jgi:hypothetical protein
MPELVHTMPFKPVEECHCHVAQKLAALHRAPNLHMSQRCVKSAMKSVDVRPEYTPPCWSIALSHEDCDHKTKHEENLLQDLDSTFLKQNAFQHPPSEPFVDTVFSRAKSNRVILPDPLTVSKYYHVGKRGLPSRQLSVFTPIINHLAKSEDTTSLCSLRLVSMQFYYMATYALHTYNRVSLSNPDEYDTISIPTKLFNLIPPLLPNAPYPRPDCIYSPGHVLELLPENPEEEPATFVITEQIAVGGGQKSQVLEGIFQDGKYAPRETTMAHIFDPMYVEFLEEIFPGSAKGEVKPHRCIPRRVISWIAFSRLASPLRTLSEMPIKGHRPLVPRPRLYRLFFPARELASERGVAVVIWAPKRSTPLRLVSQHYSIDELPGIATAVADVYLQLLAEGAYYPDFLKCVGIDENRNVVLSSPGSMDMWDVSSRFDLHTQFREFQEYAYKKLKRLKWEEYSLVMPIMSPNEVLVETWGGDGQP